MASLICPMTPLLLLSQSKGNPKKYLGQTISCQKWSQGHGHRCDHRAITPKDTRQAWPKAVPTYLWRWSAFSTSHKNQPMVRAASEWKQLKSQWKVFLKQPGTQGDPSASSEYPDSVSIFRRDEGSISLWSHLSGEACMSSSWHQGMGDCAGFVYSWVEPSRPYRPGDS